MAFNNNDPAEDVKRLFESHFPEINPDKRDQFIKDFIESQRNKTEDVFKEWEDTKK